MENIYKHRLLLLASFLDNLPTERFYYGDWVGDDWQGKEDLSCGTRACALGWATTVPELREAGLRLVRRNSSKYAFIALENDIDSDRSSWFLTLKAGCEVFGLSEDEFEFVFIPHEPLWDDFSPSEGATSKEVANHIRYFISQKYGE